MNSRLQTWEDKFKDKLHKRHKHLWKHAFHRLMKKSSTLRSSLKRRSKEYEVEFDISLTEIRELLLECYGRHCRYCNLHLDVTNIVCDHITPLSMGGGSHVRNLQMICRRCNTRKGPLPGKEYKKILNFLNKQLSHTREYVLRKLAASDVMGK
tara:strand:+ start:878 stop:1336 length:459 start_codon:yes stop_codon:yes gene_type:complete